jgi:drug/metabolite transporter (DMT)-like permease
MRRCWWLFTGTAASADAKPWIAAGAEMGLWTFLGFALQSVGLQYTSVGRSAFLLYLNVKLVPVFAFLLLGRKSGWSVWTSAAAAVIGTALLCGDGSPPNIGDAYSLAAAAASAMYILRLEKYGECCVGSSS